MLEQAQVTTTVIFSTRGGEFAEIIANAGGGTGAGGGAVQGANGVGGGGVGGSRVGSLDDLDGIVVVGGDGTFFEVRISMFLGVRTLWYQEMFFRFIFL